VGTRALLETGCPYVSCSSRCGGHRVPVQHAAAEGWCLIGMQPTAAYCTSLFRVEWRASSATGQPTEESRPGGRQQTTGMAGGRGSCTQSCEAGRLSTPTLFRRAQCSEATMLPPLGEAARWQVAERSPRFPTSAISRIPAGALDAESRAKPGQPEFGRARPFSKHLSSCIGAHAS
jgi:hypothetical protein